MNKKDLPIGVFDSGMGGLTVLRQLKRSLPDESFLYLGDTARLPYGTKSRHTVVQYAKQMANILISKGIKLLVIACNTATTAALKELRAEHPELPIVGVIEPGAKASVDASSNSNILVLATETTVRSDVYRFTIESKINNVNITSLACGLFVALAEEGCINDDVTSVVIKKYLADVNFKKFDCILLGCTHFPVLKSAIQDYVGSNVVIVDSAIETAKEVKHLIETKELSSKLKLSNTHYLVTDLPERFIRIGKIFLQSEIEKINVEVVNA